MSTATPEMAIAALRVAEPEVLCRDGVATLLGDVRRVRSWLDTVEIAATRRVRELEAAGRAECAEAMIATVGGRSGRDARTVNQRSEVCDEAPALEESLMSGEVTAAHLDAISIAARGLPVDVRAEFMGHADDLRERASRVSVDTFVRECRALAKRLLAASRCGGGDADELEAQRQASKVSRWVDRVTGMHHTHLELDPLRDAKLSATFNAELARLRAIDGNGGVPWQQLQVDAFVNAVGGISATASAKPGDERGRGTARRSGARRVDRVPEATVLISHDRLTGETETGVCETDNGVDLPTSTVRRLCCDAEIVPVVVGSTGEVLDLGRSVRTASTAQRRALRAMHRGCAFPGCGVGFDACRMHHVRWWGRDLGPTDLANLLPLCERHHHLVHEGRWVLTLCGDRMATWIRPDGTIHLAGPTIDRTPEGLPCRAGPAGERRRTAVPP